MKKILSILICVLVSAAAAATNTKYAQMSVYIHPNSTGGGCVYVKEGRNQSTPACEKGVESKLSSNGDNSESEPYYEFTYTLTADNAEEGFYAAGWTQSSQSTDDLHGAATHTVILNGTTTKVADGGVADIWYAVFKPWISTSSIGTIVVKQGTSGLTSNAATIKALVHGSVVNDNLTATLC